MSNKHNLLTEEEVINYQIETSIEQQIDHYLKKNSHLQPHDLNILDWGCGRGRAVLSLLEKGFSAYGVDIDEQVIKNGALLFHQYGYDAPAHLKPLSKLDEFPDDFFHFILSEQVFEHVENIEQVLQMQVRVLAPGGIGCHVLPSAKMIRESHLNMPFVHWLPKNLSRKFWISCMLLLSKKPETQWPETEGTSFQEEVNVYYNYLNKRTYYRDNRTLKKLFHRYGFEADFIIHGTDSPKRKWLPDFLLQNGFPDQQVCFVVRKK